MLGKRFKSGYMILTDQTVSRIHALQAGFKEVIETEKPFDYSPDKYKIEYEDVGHWIRMTYRRFDV